MGNLFIAPTKRTPEIIFLDSGSLNIKGSSIPEDSVNFYKPILQWLEDFLQSAPLSVSFTIDLEYINTSSTIHILKLLNTTIHNITKKTALQIVWKFDAEDEDSLEQGEMIQKIIKHPMLFVKTQPDTTR